MMTDRITCALGLLLAIASTSFGLSSDLRLSAQPVAAILAQASSEPSSTPRLSPGKSYPQAFFRSLLVPGWGEAYAGARGEAQVFFLVEGAIWAGYIGFHVQGNVLKDDYRVYAAAHAGANTDGKSDEYLKNLGQYPTTDDYDEAVRRRAREMFYGNPAQEQEYIRTHLYSETDAWSWDSENTFAYYHSLRVRSLNAYKRGEQLVGVALLNRLISAIEAVRQVRNFNREQKESEAPWDLRLGVSPDPLYPGVSVGLIARY